MRVPSIASKPDQDVKSMKGEEPAEAARRMAVEIEALTVRADRAGHRTLVYLLDLAKEEAEKQAAHSDRSGAAWSEGQPCPPR